MRIFIAIDIPQNIRADIEAYTDRCRRLAPELKWVRPESLHITLKFVGETPDAQVQAIRHALKGIQSKSFDVKLEGIGYFPTAKAPRVFWVGVHSTGALVQLASGIDTVLAKTGIPAEKASYHPHLTLARAGPGRKTEQELRSMQQKLDAEAPPHFGTMTAREFFLYQSKLSPKGAQYTKLESFALV